jgi:hypothetical protein
VGPMMSAAAGAIEIAMATTVSKRDRNSLRIWYLL